MAGKKSDDDFVNRLEEALKEAKRNREWRREYMTLLMRDQENIEKGIEQGIEQGMNEGILAMVSALRELHIPEDIILQKVQEKFNFSREKAEKYCNGSETQGNNP